MAIAHNENRPLWLLFVFSLPAKRASQRVEIWRLLKRYGSVGLRSSGYVLPNNSQNLERFEWLAAAVRKYRGEASVIHVESIDNLPSKDLSGGISGSPRKGLRCDDRRTKALQRCSKARSIEPSSASLPGH